MPLLIIDQKQSATMFYKAAGDAFKRMKASICLTLMRSRLSGLLALLIMVVGVNIGAADESDTNTPPSKPTPYLTPEEELKTFQLPEGYSLQLVVGDPIIKEPVVAAFDGNGRMYVAEMRTYMQNIDGVGELVPTSRVSLHWSSKGDGVYDKHSVFIDHLLLPRMILPLGTNGVLVNETDSDDIWLYRDTKGDGIADMKELFYAGGNRGENLEHQSSGLIWAKDNWLYQTLNSYRLRVVNGTNSIKENTPANGGQWGAAQDDYDKIWFVNASGEQGPTDYQEPFIYGNIKVQGEPSDDFMQVWPLVGLGDVQGGLHRVRPENQTLNYTTSGAGIEIYRGDRLPSELYGNMFFDEPVGRLIRRSLVENKDGITHLTNAYGHSEFIRSTDPNFRPVNIVTAPDGTLYIVDMYRGIIQESAWVTKGSYLRPKVQENQLENNFGRGRIWRLTYQGMNPGPQPHMLDQTPAELVPYLGHPNGWWRDTAQKLLVLSGDKSVVPALVDMAQTSTNPLARIDALWTLEGLNAVQPDLIRSALKDQDAHVRSTAIRVSESLYKQGDHSLVADVTALTNDPDPNVVIQVLMTANLLQWTNAASLIQATVAANSGTGISEIGSQLHQAGTSFIKFSRDERRILDRGETIYKGLCFACHGQNGEGAPVPGSKAGTTIAPPFAHAKISRAVSDGIISVLLKGMKGPVNGKTYDAQMLAMESNDDAWIAAVTSYIRNSFGNSAPVVRAADVARVRAALKDRSGPWTEEELLAAVPQALTNREDWKVTANYNPQAARLAIDGNLDTRYDTGTPQVPGMWFQIELPQETTITGLRLNAATSDRDYPRGYKVELSDDGTTWTQPVAKGAGSRALTDIFFTPAKAKFIRITQTSSVDGLYWSIHELAVYTPGVFDKTVQPAKPEPSKFE
jgi:mono/diheme cytochrome c family protein/glucose/arabinose dehydrogenase